jgi:predicted small integral membrane protein
MFNLDWMQWTPPTIAIFIGVVISITGMAVWDYRSPSTKRKGFLPFGFTRGERLFLSILIFLGTMILFMAFLPDTDFRLAFPVAAVLIFIVVRWG